MVNLFKAVGRTALLVVFLCLTFYGFRATTLIGDGLRHLPALRTITSRGAVLRFEPKPWLEVYRNNLDHLVVQHHFLFGATMSCAFALQQKLGFQGDAVVAMSAVNALSGAIGGALFFLLAMRVGLSKLMALFVTLGLCLSPAYLLAATNIDEVALSLPFFIGALLLLIDRPFAGWTPLIAGVLAAFATLTYLLAGSLVPGIAVAAITTGVSIRSGAKPLFVFLSSFGLVFVGVFITILFVAGFHSPGDLFHAILRSPFEQGTYGKFKIGSAIATPVGLAESFLPILPDDFRGLRLLYQQSHMAAYYVALATLVLCAFLAWVFYALAKDGKLRSLPVLSCALTFLLVEGVCFEWDGYYQKLQIFALILCWLMVAVAIAGRQMQSSRWLFLIFFSLVIAGGLWTLRNNVQPSRPRKNAEQLYSIVGNGVLITGWASDVAQMWLYANGNNIISLPDFALARKLNADRVQTDLNAIVEQARGDGRNVYFYGVFDENGAELSDIYETKFRLTGFTAYLQAFQRKARPIANLPQPGGHAASLYVYTP